MPFTNNDDLLAIKDELTNDPNGLGLTMNPSDDVANANKLNEIREEQQIDRTAIPGNEIAAVINRIEYNATTLADRQWIDLQVNSGLIDASEGSEQRTGFLGIFGPLTTTRANLQALLTEAASRINQMHQQGLLSQGGNVTPSDIANARNAT